MVFNTFYNFCLADNRIRELERQLGEVRKLRDNQDELEALRLERERLDSHVKE